METLIALWREFPPAPVLMLSVDAEDETVKEALQAGAAGYLSKSTELQELLQAIRAIHASEHYLPPALPACLHLRTRSYNSGANRVEFKSSTNKTKFWSHEGTSGYRVESSD